MNKPLDVILRIGVCVFLLASVAGFYQLATRQDDSYQTPLIVAGFASCMMILVSLYEILSSKRISRVQKAVWVIGFFLLNSIAALVYFFTDRKRVTG